MATIDTKNLGPVAGIVSACVTVASLIFFAGASWQRQSFIERAVADQRQDITSLADTTEKLMLVLQRLHPEINIQE